MRRLYRVLRDLHLYFGLLISPFVLVFAISVFFLVHPRLPGTKDQQRITRVVEALSLPESLESLSGRALIDALKPALESAGIHGEVGWVQHFPDKHQFVLPISVPGRLTTVTVDVQKHKASVESRNTGWADALILLHKSPGPAPG